MSLYLSGDEAADQLLSTDPLALWWAWSSTSRSRSNGPSGRPFDLQQRLGARSTPALAAMDPEALVAVFSGDPALHRFPPSMAGRVQELCTVVVDSYGGDAAAIWTLGRRRRGAAGAR